MVVTANGEKEALCYVSNPDGAFHTDGLDLETTASILLYATPHQRGKRACGVHYVKEVADWLRLAGHHDVYLTNVLEEVQRQATQRKGQLYEK